MNNTNKLCPLILGIDIGTTGIKAILFSDNGKIIDSASEVYPLITPGVRKSEQNAENWWQALVRTVRKITIEPSVAARVRAVSLSTQGGTVVPVDAGFNPLSNAIVWSDTRCEEERLSVLESPGEKEIFRRSGWTLKSGRPMLQLMHMRKSNPDLFRRARYFLTVPDFITARLTGRAVIDYSNAGINQLFNLEKLEYDPILMEIAGIREDRLAELSPSCTPIGTLTKSASEELGLPESVVVSTGAHDQYAVALGAGIRVSGDAVIGTGTAWVVTALNERPDLDCAFSQSVAASENMFGTMISISTGGVCLDWLRKQILSSKDAPIDYDAINSLAMEHDVPGSNGLLFYPYFSGAGLPRQDMACLGTLVGMDLSHDRGHITRAVMEGVACQIAWAVNSLDGVHPIRKLFLAGGATKSPVWTRIIAEVTGRELQVSSMSDLSCAGAAMMAGVGCGLYADTAEAIRQIVPPTDAFCPDPARADAYSEVYHRYVKGAHALSSFYRSI